MRKTLAIVFAGGRAKEMSVLTLWRPTSAVLFGGRYRVIDFALSNLANTKAIEHVGVLSQYRPSSLIDHIGIGLPWDFVGVCRSLRMLSPYTGPKRSDWYRGTADALYQNIGFLNLHQPDDVLIVSGDHAYNMDYEALLRFHMEHAADVTLGFTPRDKDPSRFGIAEINAEGRVVNYVEKPKHPRTHFASMTVYVFKCQVLLEELKRHAEGADKPRSFHIYDEIIPRMIERRRAFGYVHHGPWEYTRTLDDYFKAHQEMLGENPRIPIEQWGIRTNLTARKSSMPAPTRYGPRAHITNSLISAGCDIAGHVENSVLSPDVHVAEGAVVKNSILWNGVNVHAGAQLDQVICDKRCVIESGAVVGMGDATQPNSEVPESLNQGATVLGMDVHVPKNLKIGRNCIVYPRASEEHFAGNNIACGETICVAED